MDQEVVSKYGKKKYSLDDLLRSYGLNPRLLNGEHENHQRKFVNNYTTFYKDDTADWKYFFQNARLFGWTRLMGKFVINPNIYDKDRKITIAHEAKGHLQYNTGDENFVESIALYSDAIGENLDPYMVSVQNIGYDLRKGN